MHGLLHHIHPRLRVYYGPSYPSPSLWTGSWRRLDIHPFLCIRVVANLIGKFSSIAFSGPLNYHGSSYSD